MKTETRLDKWLNEGAEEYREKQKKEKLHTEFEATDKASIKKLSDAELARWQSKYPSGSPQTIFAEQLWKYRHNRHSAKFTAMIAIASAIVGGIIGHSLPRTNNEISKQEPQQEIRHNNKPPPKQEINEPSKIPATNNKLLSATTSWTIFCAMT